MNTRQQGFTLIELIVVIVILGILAATALPKFIDLSSDAGTAAAQGIAGAIASGTSINYGAKAVGNASAVGLSQSNVCTSTILSSFVSGTSLVAVSPTTDKEFMISGTGNCSGSTTTTVSCTVTPKTGTAATATVTCAR